MDMSTALPLSCHHFLPQPDCGELCLWHNHLQRTFPSSSFGQCCFNDHTQPSQRSVDFHLPGFADNCALPNQCHQCFEMMHCKPRQQPVSEISEQPLDLTVSSRFCRQDVGHSPALTVSENKIFGQQQFSLFSTASTEAHSTQCTFTKCVCCRTKSNALGAHNCAPSNQATYSLLPSESPVNYHRYRHSPYQRHSPIVSNQISNETAKILPVVTLHDCLTYINLVPIHAGDLYSTSTTANVSPILSCQQTADSRRYLERVAENWSNLSSSKSHDRVAEDKDRWSAAGSHSTYDRNFSSSNPASNFSNTLCHVPFVMNSFLPTSPAHDMSIDTDSHIENYAQSVRAHSMSYCSYPTCGSISDTSESCIKEIQGHPLSLKSDLIDCNSDVFSCYGNTNEEDFSASSSLLLLSSSELLRSKSSALDVGFTSRSESRVQNHSNGKQAVGQVNSNSVEKMCKFGHFENSDKDLHVFSKNDNLCIAMDAKKIQCDQRLNNSDHIERKILHATQEIDKCDESIVKEQIVSPEVCVASISFTSNSMSTGYTMVTSGTNAFEGNPEKSDDLLSSEHCQQFEWSIPFSLSREKDNTMSTDYLNSQANVAPKCCHAVARDSPFCKGLSRDFLTVVGESPLTKVRVQRVKHQLELAKNYPKFCQQTANKSGGEMSNALDIGSQQPIDISDPGDNDSSTLAAHPSENFCMSALDYRIAEVLVKRIDVPFKPCNHEVRKKYMGLKNGEKGKLTLEDLIELQVEASIKA